MKAFTKVIKHKVFDVVKSNDIKGYNDLCEAAENYTVTTVKINLENGDYFITRISCTPEEACNYYRIGSYINIGTAADDLQRIKSLEFIYD